MHTKIGFDIACSAYVLRVTCVIIIEIVIVCNVSTGIPLSETLIFSGAVQSNTHLHTHLQTHTYNIHTIYKNTSHNHYHYHSTIFEILTSWLPESQLVMNYSIQI